MRKLVLGFIVLFTLLLCHTQVSADHHSSNGRSRSCDNDCSGGSNPDGNDSSNSDHSTNSEFIELSMEVATYTVSEDIGTVEVCAKITKGSTGYSSFVANFTVSSQSALDGGDFNRTTNVTTSLDFSGTTSSRNCIRIAVIDDSLCEADESFIVSLTENVHYVRVINTSTTIVIQDNDEVILGFESERYTENEGNELIEVCVAVQQGTLGKSIKVMLGTVGAATGLNLMAMAFDSQNARQCASIEVMERGEDVHVFLFSADPQVISDLEIANITFMGLFEVGGVHSEHNSALTVGITIATLSGALMFCVGVLMVNICSWTKGKLCQKKKTNDSLCRRSFPCICTELSEKEENAYKTCMRANVESIPTSSNAAYIRGDSLSISTNTSSFLLTTPLTCDKDKLQSSPTHQDSRNTTLAYDERVYEELSQYRAADNMKSAVSNDNHGIKCTAWSSDEQIISESAHTPACFMRDTKQPGTTDQTVIVKVIESTQTGGSESENDCHDQLAIDDEDYEVTGQVYEYFVESSGYERMGSVYDHVIIGPTHNLFDE